MVETLRGLSTEHRLELILLINTKNFSINQYGLSHNLIEFCKAVSEPHEKIVFSFLFTFFVSLEIAFRNPAKEIIFEATDSRVVELAELYKFYLGLKNFNVKSIKGFDDFSKGVLMVKMF